MDTNHKSFPTHPQEKTRLSAQTDRKLRVRPEELKSIGAQATGRPPKSAPNWRGRGSGVGAYVKTPIPQSDFDKLSPLEKDSFPANSGFNRQILIKKGLPPEDADAVLAHEIGHAISDRVGTVRGHETTKTGKRIPFNDIPVTKETMPEFRQVYSDLNNGRQPEDFGYKPGKVNSDGWPPELTPLRWGFFFQPGEFQKPWLAYFKGRLK